MARRKKVDDGVKYQPTDDRAAHIPLSFVAPVLMLTWTWAANDPAANAERSPAVPPTRNLMAPPVGIWTASRFGPVALGVYCLALCHRAGPAAQDELRNPCRNSGSAA